MNAHGLIPNSQKGEPKCPLVDERINKPGYILKEYFPTIKRITGYILQHGCNLKTLCSVKEASPNRPLIA